MLNTSLWDLFSLGRAYYWASPRVLISQTPLLESRSSRWPIRCGRFIKVHIHMSYGSTQVVARVNFEVVATCRMRSSPRRRPPRRNSSHLCVQYALARSMRAQTLQSRIRFVGFESICSVVACEFGAEFVSAIAFDVCWGIWNATCPHLDTFNVLSDTFTLCWLQVRLWKLGAPISS